MIRKKRNTAKAEKTKYKFVHAVDLETGEDLGLIPHITEPVIILDPEKEAKKKKAREYRNKNSRTEPFVQCSKEYEKIIEDYNRLTKDCLVKLMPYINFKDTLVKIDDKVLGTKDLYHLWGVSNKTGKMILESFLNDGIIIEEDSGIKNGKQYRATGKIVFRGKNNKKEFTQKIDEEELKKYITAVQKKLTARENVAKKNNRKVSPIYPLALFGSLVPNFSYNTYLLAKNNSEDVILEGETVKEILSSRRKRSRFQFMKNYELWNIYSGQNVTVLSVNEQKELKECLEILLDVGILAQWRSNGKKLFLINPKLIYSSPGFKCDPGWKEVITTLFDLTK
ncbi:TPA: hypothetical protein ACGW5B_005536 [Bacillus paranthracis]|uniref:hypothetical protein n=1 Tax=Bacillus TaxID=1386 RepID=UPI00027CCB30|nr:MULTISPECIES: hypothetical protein [unclassified Bacillus cereus group]AFQ13284.1 hypothetical protein BCK_27378 [Bacillus cereus FRI-35]MDX5839896.1 hypothetical protein [Bacillus cereus group sp. BfR-BA-01700]MDX5846239.1 hypothetical protein [Bacillus cereus group sp. BfR-BA-01233]MDX5941847.1 hypothetical protein [Bacillus cereus group sp. BfR-BA-00415]